MDSSSHFENVSMGNETWGFNSSIIDFPNRRPDCGQIPVFPSLINVISYCYVLPAVCAIGILGNIANLITLSSNRLKAVSYMYLMGLGVADLLCMIFVLIFVSFEILGASSTFRVLLSSYGVAWYRAHLVLPLINWSVSAGIIIIVALTLERYISIAWPILFREWNSPRRAIIIITAAYVVTFILYIPMCWQMEPLPICPANRSTRFHRQHDLYNVMMNMSVTWLDEEERIMPMQLEWTYNDNALLLNSPGYEAYKLTREVLLKIIPIVALTFLNFQIIIAFKKVRSRRRRLNTNSQSAIEQRSLLFLLAGIVVLFFICNIPAAMNLIIINETMKRQKSFVVFRAIANLLEITNHALNFYNFCLCSSDYRQTFCQKFPCMKRVQESAEDIKRRVSSSLAKAQQTTKAMSMNNGKMQQSTSFVVSTSLKSPFSQDNQHAPLRRALSSETLTRLDHCHIRDCRGRRFGHHYGTRRYCPARKYLAVPNGNEAKGLYRSDSDYNFFANIFEAIPEDRQLHGNVLSDISVLASPVIGATKFALVNFAHNTPDGHSNDESQSSLNCVTAEQVIVITDDSNADQETTPMATPLATPLVERACNGDEDCGDDALSYTSANDIYL